MNLTDLLQIDPYSFDQEKKNNIYHPFFQKLTHFHYSNCKHYKTMLDSLDFNLKDEFKYYDMPFLPVQLFKRYNLLSVKQKNIIKTMTSSGTSGQAVSKIYLDKENALNQTKVLTKIVSTFIGEKRAPMLIIDSASMLKNKTMFSARGAGILGFSIFGTKKHYALDENMQLDVPALLDFLTENKHRKIFIFGFTFMIYEHFIKSLLSQNINIDLSNSVLIHGGGWKKLINEAVTSQEFRNLLNQVSGIKNVHDYYGMVEQTGSIYMECEYGHLHSSIFSDIIIRKPNNFTEAAIGEKGIIQTISTLPTSYPGHSLLTEDEGILIGKDNCKCKRQGKYFKVIGRLKNAEIRGCSDTYAQQFN
ncbi:MAG: acyl-protein synthetase [Candidatus Margulisiibacteriota bacterium]